MKNNTESNQHQTSTKSNLRIVNTLLLALAAAAILAACGSDDSIVQQSGGESTPEEGTSETAESTLNPVAGNWQLIHATLEGDMSLEIPADAVPTMTIEGSTLTAFFGCNNGGGIVDYDIAAGAFTTTELGSEEMDCAEDEITRIEAAMLRVLGAATTFTSENGQLTISDGAEYPSYLDFEIVPAADAPVTTGSAELDGIQRLETFVAPEIARAEIEVSQVSDDTLEVLLYLGPICTADRLDQQPSSVLATYSPTEIAIEIDPSAYCDGDATEFRAGLTLQLAETIDGRTIVITARDDKASLTPSS